MIKIGFFGTPEIASACLSGLAAQFDVAFVVTGEDKHRGRHQTLSYCEAKEAALCSDLTVLQPHDLRDPEFIRTLHEYDADIYIVVAYGKIIPREIFDHPPLKTINLHPSLLPKYRGAAPVQWALIKGEKETGISVQLINERLDAGDIIVQEKIPLHENMTAAELYNIIIPRGVPLLKEAVNLLVSGRADPRKQNEDEATYCGKIDRDTAHIDWNSTSWEIHNLVRGLNPKPAAWTMFKGKSVKIWETRVFDDDALVLKPGELRRHRKKHLLAGTGDGLLEIIRLQPETKKVMDGSAFINGHRIEAGDSFDV